jgi:hypothetical protein
MANSVRPVPDRTGQPRSGGLSLTWIAAICGTDGSEYRPLADALEKPPGTGLVY